MRHPEHERHQRFIRCRHQWGLYCALLTEAVDTDDAVAVYCPKEDSYRPECADPTTTVTHDSYDAARSDCEARDGAVWVDEVIQCSTGDASWIYCDMSGML